MARRTVLQFKIVLQNITPVIWRRIQISDLCNFWGLHVAIQDAMGWWDCHLHQFVVLNPKTEEEFIGIPEYVYGEDSIGQETLPGWHLNVRDYLSIPENHKIYYLYDFGDGWEHLIYFEGTYPKAEKQRYPVCLDGERSCPPEDVGGESGYDNFLNIINDPKHEEHEHMLEWIGGNYEPEKFVPREVNFDSPSKRWNKAFEQE